MTCNDIRFISGATHLLAGPSGSGKTHTVCEILKNKNVMIVGGEHIKNVIFCYASWQPIYDKLQNVVTKWIPKLPTNEEFIDLVEKDKDTGGSIVVLDDFMSDIGKDMVEIVTVSARHNNASTFILFQSLFPIAKSARQISLNVKYIYVFKNPRENAQFAYLVRQISPNNYKWIVEAYEEATRDPYSFFLLDMTQQCPRYLRFRSQIFPSQWPIKVWMKKGEVV